MSAVPHLVLIVCADVNAQSKMQVDQDLAEERDVPVHYFSVQIHIFNVCIHIVRKADKNLQRRLGGIVRTQQPQHTV